MEVLLDVFPKGEHIDDADRLMTYSKGVSGEILDYGHVVAYRPGLNCNRRIDLRFSRVLRWTYRLYRALLNDANELDLIDTRKILLHSMRQYSWNRAKLLTMCRCYLIFINDLESLKLGTNSVKLIKYSDKFNNYMLSDNQFDFYIYNRAILWCHTNKINFPKS